MRSLGSRADVPLETNGTLPPDPVTRSSFDHISVSPKLANAGSHKPTRHAILHPDWAGVVTAPAVHQRYGLSSTAPIRARRLPG